MYCSCRPPCPDGALFREECCRRCDRKTRRTILTAAIIASSLSFIDLSAVNLALPAIQKDLSASAAHIQWIIQLPALFLASLLLIGGSLGDHFGLKKVLAWGLVIFVISSTGCAMAGGIRSLLFFRATLGIGGAIIIPASFSLISYFFEIDERGKAIGIWSGTTGLTVVIGQVLGGAMTTFISWRTIFLLPIPLVAIVFERMRSIPPAPPVSKDRQGGFIEAFSLFVFLGAIVLIFIELPQRGFADSMILSLMIVIAVAGSVFLLSVRKGANHIASVDMYTLPGLAGANAITFVLYGSFTGSLFFLPLYLVQIQGFTEVQAGLALSPFVVVIFLLARVGGFLTDRKGPVTPILSGCILIAFSFLLLARAGIRAEYIKDLLAPVIIMGSGFALVSPAISTTVMNSVQRQNLGAAAGLNTTFSRIAGLAGLALMGLIMTISFKHSFAAELVSAGVRPSLLETLLPLAGDLGGMSVPEDLGQEIANMVVGSRDLAFVFGFRVLCITSALLSAFSGWLAIMFFRKPAKRSFS